MKKLISLTILVLFIKSISIAQEIDGIPELTPELQAQLDLIPELFLTESSINKSLPLAVDNSNYKFMRPIFHQIGASCAQASGVGYVYTYEMNRLRNTDARVWNSINEIWEPIPENCYTYNFTFNYFNEGSETHGTNTFQGWSIIKELGCPNLVQWDPINQSDYLNPKKKINGYNVSLEPCTWARCTRLKGYDKITIFFI
jgi:hypothetical protein